MAVLVEAISVVVRRDAIDQSLAGGWAAFVDGADRPPLSGPVALLVYERRLR